MTTDSSTLSELQSLLGNNADGGSGASLLDTDAIIKVMMPITIVLTVLSVIIALLYIASLIQRMRVTRATLESRDILKEMNERDKARSTPPIATSVPPSTTPEAS